MNFRITSRDLVSAIILLMATQFNLSAQSISLGPEQGILLLKNGNIFQGTITPAGEYYSVVLNEGAVIRLSKNSIACRCKSIEEAYNFKISQKPQLTLKDHLELTQWCLTHQLIDRASNHLLICIRSEPNHPEVLQMERRFRLSLQKPQEETPTTTPVTFKQISREELERIAGSLPLGGLKGFTTKVQPLLLKGCGTTTCHGQAAKNSFRLIQFDRIRTIPRQITLRNLHSTLKFVDRKQPLQSVIFQKLRTTHAQMPELSTIDAKQQITLLSHWIQLISVNQIAEVEPVKPTSVQPALYQKIDTGNGANQVAPATINPLFFTKVQPAGALTTKAGQNPDRADAKRPESLKTYQAKDPFDPELFNRQFHMK